MIKPFNFARYEYAGKVVYTLYKDEDGIGSIELKREQPGFSESCIAISDLVKKLNEIYNLETQDKGGSVR